MYKYIYTYIYLDLPKLFPSAVAKNQDHSCPPNVQHPSRPSLKKLGLKYVQKHLEIAQLFKDFLQTNPGRIADLQFWEGGK